MKQSQSTHVHNRGSQSNYPLPTLENASCSNLKVSRAVNKRIELRIIIIHLILFQIRSKFEFITKQYYMFKFYSFSCRISLSLFRFINLLFSHIVTSWLTILSIHKSMVIIVENLLFWLIIFFYEFIKNKFSNFLL